MAIGKGPRVKRCRRGWHREALLVISKVHSTCSRGALMRPVHHRGSVTQKIGNNRKVPVSSPFPSEHTKSIFPPLLDRTEKDLLQ